MKPTNLTRPPRRELGVSLIEALLALVVMALGMLAVVGVQATLRSNADLSRQRAEAVRIAQEKIESWRSVAKVAADAGVLDYSDLITEGAVKIERFGASTAFWRTTTVTETVAFNVTDKLPHEVLKVDVTWTDRNNQAQAVTLFSTVARVAPDLAGSLAVPPNGAPARLPQGRHAAIPPSALPKTATTSEFVPPNNGNPATVSWIFNNISGNIDEVCVAGVCQATDGRLLSGYVRYAVPPAVTSATASLPRSTLLNPPSSADDFAAWAAPNNSALTVTLTYRTPVQQTDVDTACFVGVTSSDPNAPTEYFCAVFFPAANLTNDRNWTGRVRFGPPNTLIADTVNSTRDDRARVCRYFDLSGTGTYTAQTKPLSNQNYLLTRAGDGVVSYPCAVAGLLQAHQPTNP
jgi:Tfp pilus assembly protein PilV